MTQITFKRITPELSRIYDDEGCVGEVYSQLDILNPGKHYYVLHLSEDPLGPLRVFECSRIHDESRLRLLTHPYY